MAEEENQNDLVEDASVEKEEIGLFGTIGDVLMGIPRGAEETIKGAYGLVDMGTNFIGVDLPDYGDKITGEPRTAAGSVSEGIVNFGAGFVPVFGWMGRGGQIAQGVRLTSGLSKAAAAAKTTKLGSAAVTAGRATAASAVTDFAFIDVHSGNLSTLVENHPQLEPYGNILTEYLAHDEDDIELEKRLKNTTEGVILGLGLDGLYNARTLFKNAKALKSAIKVRNAGGTPDEAAKAFNAELPEGSVAADAVDEPPLGAVEQKLIDDVKAAAGDVDDAPVVAPDPGTRPPAPELPEGEVAQLKADTQAAIDSGPDVGGLKPGAGGKNEFAINIGRASSHEDVRGVLAAEVKKAEEAGLLKFKSRSHQERQLAAEAALKATGYVDGLDAPGLANALAQQTDTAMKGLGAVQEIVVLQQAMADDLAVKAKNFLANDSDENARALLEAQMKTRSVVIHAKKVKGEVAGSLASFIKTPGEAPMGSFLPEFIEGEGDEVIQTILKDLGDGNSNTGLTQLREHAQKLLDSKAAHPLGPARASQYGPNGLAMDVWVAGLLSGPETQLVNAASGAFATLHRPMERAMGKFGSGLLNLNSGDFLGGLREMKQYYYMASYMQNALRVAGTAFKQNKPILLNSNKISDVAVGRVGSSSLADEAPISGFWKYANIGLTAGQLPSRTLQMTDEFFKQINYFSQVQADLMDYAARNNLDKDWVERAFNRINKTNELYTKEAVQREAANAAREAGLSPMKDQEAYRRYIIDHMQKNYQQNLANIAQQGKEAAEQVTFTRGLGEPGQGTLIAFADFIQKAKRHNNPILSFTAKVLLPFVRTPAQLIEFAGRRSWGLATEQLIGSPKVRGNRGNKVSFQTGNIFNAIKQRNLKELAGASPAERQDYMGRLATGSFFMGSAGLLYSNSALTGSGPTNASDRRTLEMTGWQPYSIKIGDNYYSYRRLDPFSTFLQSVADFQEAQLYAEKYMGEDETQRGAGEEITAALITTFANLYRNKTFLAGVNQFMSAMTDPSGEEATSYSRLLAGSTIPMGSFLNQTNQMFVDEQIREVRSLVDAYKARMPMLSDDLRPRRNAFGEVLTRPDTTLGFIDTTTEKFDIVSTEIREIGASFSNPRKTRGPGGGVDLTEIKVGEYDAYDEFQRLVGEVSNNRGLNLRERMAQLIDTPEYQTLDDDIREDRLRSILTDYRGLAFNQLQREYPEVKDAMDQAISNARKAQMGIPRDN
tara:strand:- start:2660 stop:6337 length:3678 start_codon:yes stop_codon:yes gene_type:complete